MREEIKGVTFRGFIVKPYIHKEVGKENTYSYEIIRESDGVMVDKGEEFNSCMSMAIANHFFMSNQPTEKERLLSS